MPRRFDKLKSERVGKAVSSDPPAPPQVLDSAQKPPPEPIADGELIGPVGDGIPPHVWNLLQQSGEVAAKRLLDLLRSPRFATYSPQAQRSLIELALTRAYGLPVRKAVNVNLSSTDADAVAASLADMVQHLPEVSIAAAARSGPETGD